MREEDLLQSLQEGREEAYHFLFNTYYGRLVAFAFRIVKETEQTKDVVQNCFVKLFHKRGELVQVNNINAYLYKMVYHEALNHVRARDNYDTHKQYFLESGNDFQEKVETTEQEHRLYEAINQLPAQCRKVFIMSRLGEQKNSEIANELGLSIRTVETHISNALKSIKRSLLTLTSIFF